MPSTVGRWISGWSRLLFETCSMIVLPASNFSACSLATAAAACSCDVPEPNIVLSSHGTRTGAAGASASIRYSAMKVPREADDERHGRTRQALEHHRHVRAEEHHLAANAAIISAGQRRRIAPVGPLVSTHVTTATTSGADHPAERRRRRLPRRNRACAASQRADAGADHPRDRLHFFTNTVFASSYNPTTMPSSRPPSRNQGDVPRQASIA